MLPVHSVADGHCSCDNAECPSPSKHPRTKHGLNDASTQPDQVRLWWRQWPNANIGVAVPDGMVVLGIAEAVANAKGGGTSQVETAMIVEIKAALAGQ